MTFIVGWKRNGHGFLCADSALTTSHTDHDSMPEVSSFGEQTIKEAGRQVSERSMKIFNLQRVLVAVCGSVAHTTRVVTALRDELRHVDDIRVAFARSLEETLPDEDSKGKVYLILAAPNGADATVLFFNANGERDIRELGNDEIIRFGSIGERLRTLTASAISQIATSVEEPRQQLTCILSVLQSFGTNKNHMEQGVGGAFYGGYVTPTEIKWQDDILYVIRQPSNYWTKLIATSIRENTVVVKSEIKKGAVIVANTLNIGFNAVKWWEKWRLAYHCFCK